MAKVNIFIAWPFFTNFNEERTHRIDRFMLPLKVPGRILLILFFSRLRVLRLAGRGMSMTLMLLSPSCLKMFWSFYGNNTNFTI